MTQDPKKPKTSREWEEENRKATLSKMKTTWVPGEPKSSAEKTREKVEALIEVFLRLEPGEVLSHLAIEDIIDRKRDNKEDQYYDIVGRAATMCRERYRVIIENRYEQGYKRLMPDETPFVADHKMELAVKGVARAVKYTSFIPIDQMSPNAKAAAIKSRQDAEIIANTLIKNRMIGAA